MLLAIDTSTRYAGITLLRDGRLTQLAQWHSQRNHTVELLPAIQSLLAQAGVTVRDLTGIAVARGPGGFSALRVGMSVAKGLAFALDVPMVTASTLEAEAFGHRAANKPLGAVLDAGRGEVFWAWFQCQGGTMRQVSEEKLGLPSTLAEEAPAGVLLCGEGLERHGEGLAQALGARGGLALPYAPALRVTSLAYLGQERLKEGKAEDPVRAHPLYLRRPSINLPPSSPPRPTEAD